MKHPICLLMWILIASGLPAAPQQSGIEQANASKPANIGIDHDVSVENWRVLDIFLNLMRSTGLHGGFVEIAHCSELPKGRLQIKRGLTVRQAMDALVAANPGYRWELKDGVVDLMPRADAPFLDTKVRKFQMDATDMETTAVLEDLLRLEPIREHEASLGLEESMSGGGLSAGNANAVPRQPVPVHIEVKDLSLRDAFNKIVQSSPKAVWIYRETDCNGTKRFTVEAVTDY